MKKLPMILAVLLLSGCSALSLIPSKWDGNEAKVITDIQVSTRYFDCANPAAQINELSKEIEWFKTYSQFRGTRDVGEIFKEITTTVSEFKERTDKGPVSPMYCDLNKKILIQQSDLTAKAVQGRFK